MKNLDLVICFIDGAWRKGNLGASIGWSISRFGVAQRGSEVLHCVGSPLAVEALAVRRTLKQALSLGIKRINLRSDSLSLISAINKGEILLEIHGVLHDISNLFPCFESTTFSYVRRSCNVEIDEMAKKALNYASLNYLCLILSVK